MDIKNLLSRLFYKNKPTDWESEAKSVTVAWKSTCRPYSFISALFQIEGVAEPIVVIEYIDRHAIEIIVTGGDDQQVSRAIFNTKPIGVLVLGNTATTHDFAGVPYVIKFTRPLWINAVTP